MGNCDPYSDSPEPLVVEQPQSTRVEEPTLLCNHVAGRPNATLLHVAQNEEFEGDKHGSNGGKQLIAPEGV